MAAPATCMDYHPGAMEEAMTQADLFTPLDMKELIGSYYDRPHTVAIVQSGSSIIPRQPDGQALRDAGIAATLQAERQEWLEHALKTLARFVGYHNDEFTAEEFRIWWLGCACPEPHSHHVWGALFNTAAKQGLIKATGRYVKAKSTKTHAHPVQLWTRA